MLEIWKKNSTKYPTVDQYLSKFDPFFEHPIRNSNELREKMELTISELTDLESHFRLQLLYLRRNQAIDKDFRKILGKNCVRITHDAKNPLVIGKGGPGEIETNQQKRVRGICGCYGTMAEYAHDNEEIKTPCRAFNVTLTANKDKSSNALLQNLFHSLGRSPIKDILSSNRITQLEVCTDNARPYISRQFLYGATKTMSRMFPNLELIR